jgi:3-oxoacyl-[acyl-carrier protein] reductase
MLFTEAKQAFSRVDIVVINAGIKLLKTLGMDFTEEQFYRVFSLKTKELFYHAAGCQRH